MKYFLNFLLALIFAALLARWIYLSLKLWLVYRHDTPIRLPITLSKFHQKPRAMHWLLIPDHSHAFHHPTPHGQFFQNNNRMALLTGSPNLEVRARHNHRIEITAADIARDAHRTTDNRRGLHKKELVGHNQN